MTHRRQFIITPHDRYEDIPDPDGALHEHHHDLETQSAETEKKIC